MRWLRRRPIFWELLLGHVVLTTPVLVGELKLLRSLLFGTSTGVAEMEVLYAIHVLFVEVGGTGVGCDATGDLWRVAVRLGLWRVLLRVGNCDL